jgi:hypothetical protein
MIGAPQSSRRDAEGVDADHGDMFSYKDAIQ